MFVKVIKVQVLEPYRLRLAFDDGTHGEVDITELVAFDGVFAPLHALPTLGVAEIIGYSGPGSAPGGVD